MATRNDFEKRQRERERQARIRQKRNKTIFTAVAAALVVVIAIASIASCNSKKNNQEIVPENVNNNLTTTAVPENTATNNIEGVANIPAASEENDLLEIVENSSAQKYAYLTFDDGPTEKITPQILDVLRRFDVKATFFQVGSYVKKLPDVTRRVHEEGHLVASHSYTHNYDKIYDSTEAFEEEISDSYDLISQVIGEEAFKLFRFPGGSYNSGDYGKEKQEYKKTLQEMGFYYADWNALNGDAEGKTKNAAGLVEYFKDTMPEGEENLVILMHDAATKQATVDALDDIINYLISEGYSFHRLDEIPYSSAAAAEAADTEATEEPEKDNSKEN